MDDMSVQLGQVGIFPEHFSGHMKLQHVDAVKTFFNCLKVKGVEALWLRACEANEVKTLSLAKQKAGIVCLSRLSCSIYSAALATEEVKYTVKEAFSGLLRLCISTTQAFRQFLKKLTLFSRQFGRHNDLHHDELIATTT